MGRREQRPTPGEPQEELRAATGVTRGRALGRLRGGITAASLLVAAVLVAGLAVLGSAKVQPGPVLKPTPADIAGAEPASRYTIESLLAARDADRLDGQVEVEGFWSDRTFPHTCAPLARKPTPLEMGCHDLERGITAANEPVGTLLEDGRFLPPSGPVLYPYLDPEQDFPELATVAGTLSPPVTVVVLGHFDDPRAQQCPELLLLDCRNRFVLDKVLSFESNEAVLAPTPDPTPFPFTSPPEAKFSKERCAGDVPYAIAGWVPSTELGVDIQLPTAVYAMVTEEVVQIGEWIDDPERSGRRFRTFGRLVCIAREWDAPGTVQFTHVPGTAYREWDDGATTRLEE